MKPGPVTARHLEQLRREWRQGEHVVITGPTGSGKTNLARYVVEQRIQNRGFVVNFVQKLKPDETILKEYRGWTRWERMKARPNPSENRILLWPRLEGLSVKDALKKQREVFGEAMDIIVQSGNWTVQNDEGLYFVHPQFLNLGAEWAMAHAMGRSSRNTLITLAQRPAHMPLLIWTSASYAYVGQSREAADAKRLSEMGGNLSSKELEMRLRQLGRHDFLSLDVAHDSPERVVNLAQ